MRDRFSRQHSNNLEVIVVSSETPRSASPDKKGCWGAPWLRRRSFVWTHGRALLAVSAVLDLTANAYIMVSREALEGPSVMLSLMAGGLDLVFLAYVLSSRRVRDAFSDFPPALASI